MINEEDKTVVYDKEQMAAVPAGSVKPAAPKHEPKSESKAPVRDQEVKRPEPMKVPVETNKWADQPLHQKAPLPSQSSFTRSGVSGMVDSKQIKDKQK